MKRHIENKYGFPSGKVFWCLSFIYASFMALMFQKLIVPMMPNLHAGNGLLSQDAVVFHELASQAANLIKEQGWSQWHLYHNGLGNVGLLSAVYAVFGPDPVFFIPLNAAAHAVGALMIYLLGQRLWAGRVGCLGGLIGGVLFLVFPSSLQWYGQNHKDAFAIAGILIMLYAWLSAFDREFTGRISIQVVLMFVGAALLAIVRPYYPVLTLAAFSMCWFLLLLAGLVSRSLGKDWRTYSMTFFLLIVISMVSMVSMPSSKNFAGDSIITGQTGGMEQGWTWKRSAMLPGQIDRALEHVARTRAYFIAFNRSIGAGSLIDADRSPEDAVGLFSYLPRALMIGLFAPFPNTWMEKVSPPRLVGAVETLVWYIVAAGIIALLAQRRTRPLFAGLIFVVCLIIVLSCVHPNIGTLYRQRYGLWMFILLCGSTGWANIIMSKLLTDSGSNYAPQGRDISSTDVKGSRRMETLAASGTVVLLITLCGYLGFMARDLMLVRIYGMNAELDAYFSAAMIPMFLVTFMAMPLSDALTAPFLRKWAERNVKQTVQLVRKVMFLATLILGVMTVLVVSLSDRLLPLFIGSTSTSALNEGVVILCLFAPIILLSAWTIVGNCILNALQFSRQAALIQLIVPVVAIGTILVAPAEKVLYGAALGMLVGTMLNAGAVLWVVKRLGLTLWPANTITASALRDVSQSYLWLAAAAFLTVAANPLNYFFAGTIQHGAISAWALASKIVVLFNGLASVGIAAVVLPHLARLVTHRAIRVIKSDIFFMLFTGTWIGFGLALVVFVFSEPLIFALFHGGQVPDGKVKELADVVKIGCLQLPMVVAYALLVKIVAVTGRSNKALLAALVSIIINLACNLMLVPQLGVLGLALSSVTATGVSSAYFLLVTRNVSLLSVTEALTLIFSWILLAIISVSFHFGQSGGVVATGLGLLSLAFATRWIWRSRKEDALV